MPPPSQSLNESERRRSPGWGGEEVNGWGEGANANDDGMGDGEGRGGRRSTACPRSGLTRSPLDAVVSRKRTAALLGGRGRRKGKQ